MFWQRHLFKKALLEDDIAIQEHIEKRRETNDKQKQVTEEDVKWEQEDFANDVKLTEKEQIRLLEEYEQETKQKKKNSDLKNGENSGTQSPSKENFQKTVNKDSLNTEVADNESTNNMAINCSNSSTDDDWEKIDK